MKGTNVELNAKKTVRPDTTSHRVEDIPVVDVHGRMPNFPGEPNNPGDVVDLGQDGISHGWFHK